MVEDAPGIRIPPRAYRHLPPMPPRAPMSYPFLVAVVANVVIILPSSIAWPDAPLWFVLARLVVTLVLVAVYTRVVLKRFRRKHPFPSTEAMADAVIQGWLADNRSSAPWN